LSLATKAGLTQIDLGIESGSPRTLERLKKKTTVEQIIAGVNLAKKHVKVSGFFMIGCPGETHEDIEMTFALAKTLNWTAAAGAFTTRCRGPNFMMKCWPRAVLPTARLMKTCILPKSPKASARFLLMN